MKKQETTEFISSVQFSYLHSKVALTTAKIKSHMLYPLTEVSTQQLFPVVFFGHDVAEISLTENVLCY